MKTILLVLTLMCLAGCNEAGDETPSLGTLEVHRIAIAADSAEPIVYLAVTEGDEVKPGEVLMRQDPTRVQATLRKAKADVKAAQAELSKAENGPRPQDIAAARANVAAATSDAKTARLELDREKSLVKRNFASQNNVDVLEGQFEAAVARKQAAQAELAKLLAGTRPEDIEAARGNLAVAEAQVADIGISLERTTIKSPVSGKVEAIISRVGERPKPGATVMVIAQDEQPYARVNVPEPLRTRLRAGATAIVRIDGYDKAFPGKLRWIAHDASYTPFFALTQHDRSHLSYLAEVVLNGKVHNLPTGLPVRVTFPDVRQ